MIHEYIYRKLEQFYQGQDFALYDIASHGGIFTRSRLLEISERYWFTVEEQQQILGWAIAQVEATNA